ncbi:MAG: hypothetical protein WC819_06460 [Parcubacteria group bacterium]
MPSDDNSIVYLSWCMMCSKVYKCTAKENGQNMARECNSCTESFTCIWRDFNESEIHTRKFPVSHGYCSPVCTIMDGDNVDLLSVDDIIELLSSQRGFKGDLRLLRHQMESLMRRARLNSFDEEKIITEKKDLLLRLL